MPSTQSVQLLEGYVVYLESSVVNDFESMTPGTCTTLSGEAIVGVTTFGSAYFLQR